MCMCLFAESFVRGELLGKVEWTVTKIHKYRMYQNFIGAMSGCVCCVCVHCFQ